MKVYSSFQRAFVNNLELLESVGDVVSPRGMETKELLMHSFKITNPNRRMLISESRAGNVFAQVAETLWVLAGRNDLKWLEEYIPSVRKWSDDGRTWRAGYGPRLRKWRKPISPMQYGWVDQVEEVYAKLNKDPDTRQAIISIWDPALDWVKGSKDYPCNNWLHFVIRNGALHLNVAVRSNDAVFGFSHADFFGWSVLQQLMASWLNVSVGTMTWNATSYHIYAKHYEKARAIVKEYRGDQSHFNSMYDHIPETSMGLTFQDFHSWLNLVMYTEEEIYRKTTRADDLPRPIRIDGLGGKMDEFTYTAGMLLWLWHALRLEASDRLLAWALDRLPTCDMALSALWYVERKRPGIRDWLQNESVLRMLKWLDGRR